MENAIEPEASVPLVPGKTDASGPMAARGPGDPAGTPQNDGTARNGEIGDGFLTSPQAGEK